MLHRRKLLVAMAIAGLWSTSWPAAASPPQGTEGCKVPPAQRVTGEITHATWPIAQTRPDGSEIRRTYTIHVPAEHQDSQLPPLPIVFDLHGAFLSGFHQDKDSRMSAMGREKGFIAAQPDSWPWWATAPNLEALRGGGDDVEYMARLLDTFNERLCFDRNRIFIVGGQFYGTTMATVLACASLQGRLHNHRIAAVAAVTSLPIPAIKAPPWEKRPRPDNAWGWGYWLVNKWITVCPELSGDPIPLLVIFSSNDLTLAPIFGGIGAAGMADPSIGGPSLEPEILRTVVPRLLISRDDALGRNSYRVAGEKAASAAEATLKLACFATALWSADNGCISDFLAQCSQLQMPVFPSSTDGWLMKQADIQPGCWFGNARKDVRFVVFGTGFAERNGHVWPDGSKAGAVNATDLIWTFFDAHPR